MITVYVASMVTDILRRTYMETQFTDDFNFQFIDAVDGSLIPEIFLKAHGWHGGKLGCLLTHLKIWEMFIETTEQYCIVVEDDINISNLKHFNELIIPDDADYVFLGAKMSPNVSGNYRIIPLFEAVLAADKNGAGIGTCGYYLTKQAAQKLLRCFKRDRYNLDIDVRLLHYMLTPEIMQTLPKTSMGIIMGRTHGSPIGMIKGYSVSKPLVTHFTEAAKNSRRISIDKNGKWE